MNGWFVEVFREAYELECFVGAFVDGDAVDVCYEVFIHADFAVFVLVECFFSGSVARRDAHAEEAAAAGGVAFCLVDDDDVFGHSVFEDVVFVI